MTPAPPLNADSLPGAPRHGLDRSLGLLHATASNMATMVGIGPFITFPMIVSAMGGPQAMLGWAVGAVIALSDGQVWAELSTSHPGAGGTFVYLREAYRPYVGKLMAYLFIWTFLFSGPFEIASGIVGMVSYLSYLTPSLDQTALRVAALGIGLLTIALHYNRVRIVGTLTVVLWAIMLVTVAATIGIGLRHFRVDYATAFPTGWFTFSWGFLMGLGGASMIAIFDLMGYYNICYVEEEVQDPGRVLPRAILWSVIGVTAAYATMNLLVLGVLPWNDIASSRHIVTDIVQKYYGTGAASVMTVLVALTAYGSIFSLMMSYSRLPFAAARDGFFFSAMSAVHPTKRFPHRSLLLVGGVTTLACLFDLEFIIAAAVSSRILIQFMGQIVGLTLLRRDRPDLPRPFRMWLYPIPSVLAFAGFGFIFLTAGVSVVSLGLVWLMVGVLSFLGWARHRREWPFAALATDRPPGAP